MFVDEGRIPVLSLLTFSVCTSVHLLEKVQLLRRNPYGLHVGKIYERYAFNVLAYAVRCLKLDRMDRGTHISI